MKEFFQEMKDEFILNFIDGNMWKWLVDGLKNTLIITFFSLIIGVAIGIIVASVRSTFDKNQEAYRRRGGFFYYFQWCINALANVYLTVIRGTPVVVQLLISYFIIFSSSRNFIAQVPCPSKKAVSAESSRRTAISGALPTVSLSMSR